MLTKVTVKLKGGGKISKGVPVRFQRTHALIGDQKVTHRAAARALGLKEPSYAELESWVSDSLACSVLGHEVEPDGFDKDGSPSWLLALGLI